MLEKNGREKITSIQIVNFFVHLLKMKIKITKKKTERWIERKTKTRVAESWELEIKNRRAEVITESKYKLRTNVMESEGNAVNTRRRKDTKNYKRRRKEEKE